MELQRIKNVKQVSDTNESNALNVQMLKEKHRKALWRVEVGPILEPFSPCFVPCQILWYVIIWEIASDINTAAFLYPDQETKEEQETALEMKVEEDTVNRGKMEVQRCTNLTY